MAVAYQKSWHASRCPEEISLSMAEGLKKKKQPGRFGGEEYRDWEKKRRSEDLERMEREEINIFGGAQGFMGWRECLTPLERTDNLWLVGFCPNIFTAETICCAAGNCGLHWVSSSRWCEALGLRFFQHVAINLEILRYAPEVDKRYSV